MKRVDARDWTSWERFYRANFFNSLSGYKSTSLVGTLHENGTYNLSIFNSIVHLGADPPLIGMVNRPLASTPHTYRNIVRAGWFTLNLIPESHFREAHQTSARYPNEISEFEACGFNPHLEPDIPVPFVAESPIAYALKLVEILPIRHNGTFFIIGEIQRVLLKGLDPLEDGFIPAEEAGVISSLGLDAYYSPQPLGRLAYAKPELP